MDTPVPRTVFRRALAAVIVASSLLGGISPAQADEPDEIVAGVVTVQGSPMVGRTLTVTSTPWEPADTTLSHRWEVNGVSVAEGVTSLSLTADMLGLPVAVSVTGSRPSVESVTVVAAAGVVEAGAFVAPEPIATPRARIGSELRVTVGSWSPVADSYSYQWFRGGVAIPGTTTKVYSLTEADFGKPITVDVTGVKAGYRPTTVTSNSSSVLPGEMKLTLPKIVGKVVAGGRVRVQAPVATPGPAVFTYRWTVGATTKVSSSTEFVIPHGTTGENLTVTAYGKRHGYLDTQRTSRQSVVGVGDFTPGKPKITGTAVPEKVLVAQTGSWTPAPDRYTYRWYRDGKEIPGAERQKYRMTVADVGKKISVRVSALRMGYTTARAFSASRKVEPGRLSPAAPIISGQRAVGQMLRATVSGWSPKPSSYRYQWLRNGKAIKGATGAEYRLRPADGGVSITLQVTASLKGYRTATATSKAATVPRPTTSFERGGAIGRNIQPGLYVSAGGADCSWRRTGYRQGEGEYRAGGDLGKGQRIVAILSQDTRFDSTGCAAWKPVAAGNGGKPAVPGDGVYAVGVHVKSGLYRSTGGRACEWRRLGNFRGLLLVGDKGDLITRAAVSGPATVRIAQTDQGFESRGCGSWTRIGN